VTPNDDPPPNAAAVAPMDPHLAEYERLRAEPNGGRLAAAVYYVANKYEIDRARREQSR
jgi:hypothetical protein